MTPKEFNIHNLVCIRIEATSPTVRQVAQHHWREFEAPVTTTVPDILIRDYADCPCVSNVWLADGLSVGEGWFRSDKHKYAVRMSSVGTRLTVYVMRVLPIPLNLLVQIVLLQKGFSLVHGAGVSYRGKNILLPAFGGVGKTILVSSVISAGGKVFGDDMLLVGNGRMMPYLMDLSIYDYHLPILGITDKKIGAAFQGDKFIELIISIIKNVDSRLGRAIQYLLRGLKKNCFSLPAQSIFGQSCQACGGPIDVVCFLIRRETDDAEIKLELAEGDWLAKVCASILAHEWAPTAHEWYVPASLFGGWEHLQLFNLSQHVIREALVGRPCYIATIPVSLPPREYSLKILPLLDSMTGV